MTIVENGRKSGGFSLRRSLEDQRVDTEEAMRNHLAFVYQTLQVNERLDITRYRVNKNYPNGGPYHG